MKTKITSETYRPICKSHKCNVCGRKLRTNMSKGEKIFLVSIAVFWIVMMIGSTFFGWWNNDTSGCYTREYISGRGTDFETLRNTDIKCPIE